MPGSDDPGRLSRAFAPGRPALIAYLMAGYPDRAGSLQALIATARAGADVIELGVPYADPVADGPVIVAAAEHARAENPGGFGLAETLELAAESLADAGAASVPPVVLMTYLNPMMRFGLPRLAAAAAAAGVAGFIVPDMPPDNPIAAKWLEVAAAHGLDTIFLVAPTSTAGRIAKSVEASSGFVYVVSSLGVTGEREELPAELGALVGRVREAQSGSAASPVAVGFGVSTPEQAAAVARVADGVIVGSAIVRRQADPAELRAFVTLLAEAVHDGA